MVKVLGFIDRIKDINPLIETMELFLISLFLFGLAIGSFLNVAISRFNPDGKLFDFIKLSGRSRCPHCLKELTVLELIPLVSFFMLRGKCKNCSKSISWQYPLVEFLSGAIFITVPLFLNKFYGISNAVFFSFSSPFWYYILVLAWVLVFLIFLVMTVIDLKHYIIPDELNITLAVFGVVIMLILNAQIGALPVSKFSFLEHYAFLFSSFKSVLANHLSGAAFGGIFFWLLFILSRGRGMGFGDVKLALASGLLFGWPDIGLATMIAFIFGGVFGFLLLISKKKTMKDKVPFAPFFVFGMILTFFFGFQIINSHFAFFNL